MKIFRKNQIIITTLALMIAAAGYLSYMNDNVGDEAAKEASAEISEDTYEISDEDGYVVGEIFTDEIDPALESAELSTEGENTSADAEGVQENNEATADASGVAQETGEADITNPGEAVLTQSVVGNVDYAVEMKLNREQVRSQNKETLMGLVNNTNITEEQKQDALNQIVKLTDIAEREAATEMLLEAKGFTDVVVSITDDTVDVILDMGEVTDAKRAQVEDIVKRKTNISAENIVISPIDIAE